MYPDRRISAARDTRFRQMTVAMVSVGSALRDLAHLGLPPVVAVGVGHEATGGLRVRLQLGPASDAVGALCAWAAVIDGPLVTAVVSEDRVRLQLVGVVGGEPVVVWSHILGSGRDALVELLDLPVGGEQVVRLAALRALAQARATSGVTARSRGGGI